MPAGREKSGRFRRIFVKTPGGKTVIHYRQQKASKAHCRDCHKVLSGVPAQSPAVITKLPKTARRPERPYGGILCSPCMRKALLSKVRGGAQ